MALLRNLYPMTLTYFFKIKNLICHYLANWYGAKIRSDFKYQVFKQHILFSKMQMITKLFLQICFHLYGTRRRVALIFFMLASIANRLKALTINVFFLMHLRLPSRLKFDLIEKRFDIVSPPSLTQPPAFAGRLKLSSRTLRHLSNYVRFSSD